VIPEVTVGAASLMGALVFATGVVRWAVTPVAKPGQHRARRSRPVRRVEEYVPAYLLVPAQQLSAPCPDCGSHVTITTTTGSTL
jgi:hypothetical protein